MEEAAHDDKKDFPAPREEDTPATNGSDTPPTNGSDASPVEPDAPPLPEQKAGADPDQAPDTEAPPSKKKGAGDQIRPGVYHVPQETRVRLVRPHRYRSGMFEVYEFQDSDLSEELQEKVQRQGGWRDQDRQWYELVEDSSARRLEINRRHPESNAKCPWKGWIRLGSRYSPPRPCTSCSKPFRHADDTKTLCGSCVNASWEAIDKSIDSLQRDAESEARLPKGCWQHVQDIRDAIDKAQEEKRFGRVRLARLRQKLHPVYRVLIERRRQDQTEYRRLVEDLEGQVKSLLERSQKSDKPERSVVEDLRRIRIHLRKLVDDKRLGIREFRRLIEDLRQASLKEEEKFKAQRAALDEKQKRWEEGEKALSAKLSAIEVGVEHSTENWEKLLSLREEINEKSSAGNVGSEGRKRLLDLVNTLMDQERSLKDLAKELAQEDVEVELRVRKETSKKRAKEFKKKLNSLRIGFGYSQGLWNDLVGLQRSVMKLKNEGGIAIPDFKEVMTLVNEKMVTLKRLRGW